jgi:hypothetical protein
MEVSAVGVNVAVAANAAGTKTSTHSIIIEIEIVTLAYPNMPFLHCPSRMYFAAVAQLTGKEDIGWRLCRLRTVRHPTKKLGAAAKILPPQREESMENQEDLLPLAPS